MKIKYKEDYYMGTMGAVFPYSVLVSHQDTSYIFNELSTQPCKSNFTLS